jgi:hypothetical protein
MELALFSLGFFLLAAILRNKDLSENKDHKDRFTFLAAIAMFLIFSSIGFLYPNSMYLVPNYGFLLMFFLFFAAITVSSLGPVKVFSRIAWLSVLVFIIMGSFR